jgi:F-type H+-transporting ATPase subunit b
MAAEQPHTGPTSTGTHEPAHQAGLPQFQFEHWGGQIVWLVLIFALLYVLMSRVFVPRMRKVLDTRAQTIADAVEQARRAQDEAKAQAEAGRAEVAEARAAAQRAGAEAKARANAEAASRQAVEDERLNAKLAEAETRIRAARDKAMTNVGSIASDTAKAMIEKLTGVKATAADTAALASATAKGNG